MAQIQIVDTSVAIKWFIQEAGRAQALAILEDILASPGPFAVPELFYFELVHVLNRLIPSFSAPQQKLLDQILKLGIHRFAMTDELATQIHHFQTKGLSGYDSAYVGLAKILGGVWLTFDAKAHRKVAALGLSRLLLKN